MILIVDDDNAVRMSVSLALNRAGFEPWAVAGEEDASPPSATSVSNWSYST